jgi:adenylate kinase
MRLILLGPPGSGKGTQAKLIAKKYHLRNISIGVVLRNEVKNKSKLGLKIKPYIERGDLAPDPLVYKVLKEHIKEGNFVLDGFPRRMDQVKLLKENINAILYLECKKNEIIKRLSKRRGIKHRKDDDKETIEYRWLIYKNKSLPVINYYKKRGLLIKIDANPGVKPVFNEINKKLKKLF